MNFVAGEYGTQMPICVWSVSYFAVHLYSTLPSDVTPAVNTYKIINTFTANFCMLVIETISEKRTRMM